MLVDKRMLVVGFVVTIVAVVLLTVGMFLPHWFHPTNFGNRPDVTYSLWHAIRCTELYLCFDADSTSRVLPINPAWLLVGRVFLSLCLVILLVALTLHVFLWLCPTRTLQAVILSCQAGAGFFIFISSFIFVDAFRKMTPRSLDTVGSVFPNSLPLGFTLLASISSVFAALASGLNLTPPNPKEY